MKSILTITIIFISSVIFAQKTDIKKDTIKLDEVLVSATRAAKKDPFTKSTLSKKQLEKQNLGQDIPILLDAFPNVVTTTDTGIGVGYTGIRVRGSDATRVNVTINGIPYNDSESHGTFWVNLPDFASSVESIQLQRGVGTSTNGASAFGASLSLETEGLNEDVFVETNTSYGSFNTFKQNVKAGSGTINNHFNFSGRIATIKSDGYIDRASSDLQSFYVEGNYFNDKTSVKALAFGGREITYQSWYGIDKEILASDRTFNPAGAIYDSNGNISSFYDNQVDNYKQDHYQLHVNHQFSDYLTANAALHYTYGRGYYEQYKQGEDFADYGFDTFLDNGQTIDQTDLVRRKWLDNDFYGTTFSLQYKKNNDRVIFGGAYNKYEGDHFGKVIWTAYDNITLGNKFYDNKGVKTDFNVFAKVSKTYNKWILFADLQYRIVNYTVDGIDDNGTDLEIKDNLNFFNPKAGVTYNYNKNNDMYFSFARANKEPKRADYIDGNNPKPEQLNDFEFGWRHRTKKTNFNANMYYMLYKDQLVLTGELNDVGSPLAENVGESYRVGLELDAAFKMGNQFVWNPNVSISQNKNVDKYDNKDGVLISLGESDLSFSPNFVASNILTYKPNNKFSMSLISKYISDQYMDNTENKLSKLKGYSVSNINLQYKLKPKKYLKEIVFTALLNNIFDNKYVSNGYFYSYDDTWSVPNQTTTIYGSGYYPQAIFNFLTGVTLKF